MHRELKDLLHDATGVSGFVVSLFLDVRGFSSFARMAESSEAAVFLRRAYITILDDYFPDADFFKPTGDGLLIVLPYDGPTVAEVVNNAVQKSMDLVANFSSICDDDPMINFATPGALGVGLARGAATCLYSGEKTLDYSGRPLNLAARLMDLARPAGVVFDDSLGPDLLKEELREHFSQQDVYIKGLAEEEPMCIWYSDDLTVIAPANKQPIATSNWNLQNEELTLREAEVRTSYLWRLEHTPRDRESLIVAASHPKVVSGRRHATLWSTKTFRTEFSDEAGVPYARVNFPEICEWARDNGVRGPWPMRIVLRYQV